MIGQLEAHHLEVIEEARALAASVESFAMEADDSSTLHEGIADALRSSSLSELMVPAAYGGRFESVDPLAVCLAREALMKSSSHLDSLFALQGIGSYAISRAGSEEQRREWLPKVASCEAFAARSDDRNHAKNDGPSLDSISTHGAMLGTAEGSPPAPVAAGRPRANH